MITSHPTCSPDREDRCGNVVHKHVATHRQRRIEADARLASDVEDGDMPMVHDQTMLEGHLRGWQEDALLSVVEKDRNVVCRSETDMMAIDGVECVEESCCTRGVDREERDRRRVTDLADRARCASS